MSNGSPPHSSSDFPPQDLSASGITIPSDSEQYSSLSPPSSSPPQSSSNNNGEGSPVIIYQPPTIWGILRGAAINLLLPFVNGMMLGFGELLAHEFAFRLGWSGTNVSLCGRLMRDGETPAFLSQYGVNRVTIRSPECPNLSRGRLLIIAREQVFPKSRSSRPVGPGVEIRDDPVERRRRNNTSDQELLDTASLE